MKSYMRDIVAEVAEKHGLSVDEIKGRSIVRSICRARYEAMALMKADGHSTLAIGRFMDGRDHSCVIRGIRQHKALSCET